MRGARGAALLAALAWGATGCATVWNGSYQEVAIRSTPPGATARILPTGEVVETPAAIQLRRRLVHTVRVEREGYCPETVYLDRMTSPLLYGNFLLGGLVGIATDIRRATAFELFPDPLEVELHPRRDGDTCPGEPAEPPAQPPAAPASQT